MPNMQSPTPSQTLNQAPQSTKRRKIAPTIDPEMLETIISFSDTLADVNSNNPDHRSRAVQRLTMLSPLMRHLALARKTTGVHCAAGKFKSLGEACAILQISHNRDEHIWDRQDIDHVPSATLSAGVDTIIQQLKRSDYHTIDSS